jgi:sigma-B regulation protein RsbU (phosphoserine phosphatase)
LSDPDRTTGGGIEASALERILDVTRRLAAPFELEAMLAQVVDAARAVLQADRGTVFLYDAETHELFSMVATGAAEIRFPANRGIAGECAESRRIVNVPDCYADPRFNREVDLKTGYRTRCLLAVPLVGHDDTLVGVLQVLNKRDGVFTVPEERLAAALAAQCAVAIQRVRLLADVLLKEKMERELAVARDIQMRVLPRSMPEIPGYDIEGWSRPADETGGDTFDIIPITGGRLMLLLGDATGHGIGPALSVTQVRAMLRVAMRLGADLGAAYANINDQLSEDLADNRFVTAFLGELDAGRNSIRYYSGGQAPILHYHAATDQCEWLGSTTFAMGMMGGLPLKPPKTIDLAPGDILGVLTDGIYEYENRSGAQFGAEALAALVRGRRTEPMLSLRERIVEAVAAFADGAPQGDDMTILLVRRLS